jgi:hypothetical protein
MSQRQRKMMEALRRLTPLSRWKEKLVTKIVIDLKEGGLITKIKEWFAIGEPQLIMKMEAWHLMTPQIMIRS